jgi:hypothetical protein
MSVISCWQWWKRSFSGHGAQERALSRIAEYPDWRRTCYCVVSGFDDCYEVDHAERVERCQEPMAATAGPAPRSFEENSLEDELRFRCAPAKYLWLTRRSASRSDWVKCWENTWCPSTGQSGRRQTAMGAE